MASSSDDIGQRASAGAPAWLLWLALLGAFSPTLAELARHMQAQPWTLYALVFPLLFATAAPLDRPAHSRRDGLLWILLGLALELFGAFSGAIRLGRAGLVLAAVGLCRAFALASWRSLALLALAVPLPATLVRVVSPEAAAAALGAAGAALGALGLDVAVEGMVARSQGRAFELGEFDGAVTLVPLLAGLSWHRSLLCGRAWPRALLLAGAAVLWALPLALAGAALSLLSLRFDAAALARPLFAHAPWLPTALVGLALALRRPPRGGGSAP